jgi:hypothetical protein
MHKLARYASKSKVDDKISVMAALHLLTNIAERAFAFFTSNAFLYRQQMEMMVLQGDGKQCSVAKYIGKQSMPRVGSSGCS